MYHLSRASCLSHRGRRNGTRSANGRHHEHLCTSRFWSDRHHRLSKCAQGCSAVLGRLIREEPSIRFKRDHSSEWIQPPMSAYSRSTPPASKRPTPRITSIRRPRKYSYDSKNTGPSPKPLAWASSFAAPRTKRRTPLQ